MSQIRQEITLMLNQIGDGSTNAVNMLYPLVYEHLHDIAHHQLRKERRNHTFETSALVNEAYLKLVDQEQARYNSKAHFLAIASMAMRRILVSYARKRNAEKRGGKEQPITFIDGMVPKETVSEELIDLDHVLNKLEEMNERQAKIVQYRFFGGLSYKEIGQVLGDTEHSVRYDWRVARAWLKREMSKL